MHRVLLFCVIDVLAFLNKVQPVRIVWDDTLNAGTAHVGQPPVTPMHNALDHAPVGKLHVLAHSLGVAFGNTVPRQWAPVDGAGPVGPVVFVPGITASPLKARRVGPLGKSECEDMVPKTEWYSLWLSAAQSRNPACFLWQMQLQPPPDEGPEDQRCVKDAEGIEVDAADFGTAAAAEVLNPGEKIEVPVFREMLRMLDSLGLKRDSHIRFATYDWRKFGDPCWMRTWTNKLQDLITETKDNTGMRVTLACHSMGCPILLVFLNRMTEQWKESYVAKFVATAPPFGGAAEALSTWIHGKGPFLFGSLARSLISSWPAIYALMPRRIGTTWAEDMVIVDTPWKKFTISQLYDGSFFDAVERPAERAVRAVDGDSSWGDVRETLHGRITEQGCVCGAECGSLIGGSVQNSSMVAESGDPLRNSLVQPWCYTLGSCGSKGWQFKRWDVCSSSSKAIDAGPGFEFFPGVNVQQQSYDFDAALEVEEQKQRCLMDPKCTGFDTQGWLKKGLGNPLQDWTSISQGVTGHLGGVTPGLYMKRPKVQRCQVECLVASSSVCGSDGVTYKSECHLKNAKCWKQGVTLSSEGHCEGFAVAGIDAGRGFEYFPRMILANEVQVLQSTGPSGSVPHLDKLQEECAQNWRCGGFAADGTLLTRDFWRDMKRAPSPHKAGIYRKSEAAKSCQEDCSGEGPTMPMCAADVRKTFVSACVAKNLRCAMGDGVAGTESNLLEGPCQRFRDSGMHSMAKRWLRQASALEAPGVPTVCMYIVDIETNFRFRYRDFLSPGEVVETAQGDGTVSRNAAEVPCQQWKTTQSQPVDLMPLKLGGVSHTTMLAHPGFLEELKRVLLEACPSSRACSASQRASLFSRCSLQCVAVCIAVLSVLFLGYKHLFN